MEHLCYNVAGFDFLIETSDAKATRLLLPSFAPFEQSSCTNPIFVFSGGEYSLLDSRAQSPDDEFEWDSFTYKVYHEEDKSFVVQVFTKGQILYGLQVLAAGSKAKFSLSMTSPKSALFLKTSLAIVFGLATAPFKALKVHASVTELNGKALLFLGVSGTGKSTHSQLWRKYIPGCTLLNDDEPIVRFMPNGEVRVFGSPWSGKTPCYRNESAQVVAFVHLYQHPENNLTRLDTLSALQSIVMSSALLRSDFGNKEQVVNIAADILGQIPVFRLDCRPDKEAVELTYGIMTGNTQANTNSSNTN